MARPQLRHRLGSGLAYPAAAGVGAVTHGSQITASNTGYQAYYDSGLGRTLVAGDLTRSTGTHVASDYPGVGAGGTAGNPKYIDRLDVDEFLFDVPYVTLRQSNVRNPPISAFQSGLHRRGCGLEWVTMSPAATGDQCVQYESWTAYRCRLEGCSDGAKINGGLDTIDVTECYVRVRAQDALDHNDGLQNVGGNGLVRVTRSNISAAPVGGGGGPNAAIMSADMTSGTTFRLEVRDCWLDAAGAVETVRPYDGGLTTGITYLFTGNRITRAATAPYGRGASNTTPVGQIEWTGNVYDDDGSPILLS